MPPFVPCYNTHVLSNFADHLQVRKREVCFQALHRNTVAPSPPLLPRITHTLGAYRALCARCARAVRALCEKLAVLHHREFGKFRRLKGRH